MKLKTVVAPRSRAMTAADAVEATFDRFEDRNSTTRFHVVWIRPRMWPLLLMIVYVAPVESFDQSLAQADDLVRRFSVQ